MNCQQLANILDEQELHELSGGERAAAQEHIASCAQCARDHDMHLRVAALPIPPLDAARIAGWRALASPAAMAARTRGVARGRFILIGTLAAVAAAAALFVGSLVGGRQEAVVTAAVEPARRAEAAEAPQPEIGPAPELPVATGESRASDRGTDKASERPVLRPVTVLVQSLEYGVEDPAVQAAAREFYSAVIDGLRVLPDVNVIGPQPGIDPADRSADFHIHASAHAGDEMRVGAGAGAQWSVVLRLRIRQADSSVVQPFRTGGMFSGQDCAAASDGASTHGPHCGRNDPVSAANSILELLRMRLLPADPALERDLLARFLDASQEFAERRWALNRLLMRYSGAATDERIVRAALDLLSVTEDPSLRLELWRDLRGLRSPEMIGALIEATGPRNSAAQRLETATQLSRFPTDKRARDTLERLATNDSDLLVRKVAERFVAGPERWWEFVVTTIEGDSLPLERRLGPLMWMVGNSRHDLRISLDQLVARGNADRLAGLASEIRASDPSPANYALRELERALMQAVEPGN